MLEIWGALLAATAADLTIPTAAVVSADNGADGLIECLEGGQRELADAYQGPDDKDRDGTTDDRVLDHTRPLLIPYEANEGGLHGTSPDRRFPRMAAIKDEYTYFSSLYF